MKDKNVTLTCIGVTFYALKDEDAFFEWIKKIDCIEYFDAAGCELYLHVIKNKASQIDNLRELVALFYRYKIDMQQLKQFLTEDNKEWFDDKKTPWHKYIFGDEILKSRWH